MSEFDRYPLLYESYGFAETKVIVAAMAVGNFAYTLLQTCDSAGAPKTYFVKGDTVYANIKGKNNGPAPDGALIVIKDVDTGVELKRIGTAVVGPGAEFSALKVPIGTMPGKDWKLQFAMTP